MPSSRLKPAGNCGSAAGRAWGRRCHVMPAAGLGGSGGSGSSRPGRERAPRRVGRREGRGWPTIGLPPAAERAHRTLARSSRQVAALHEMEFIRVAAARGRRRPRSSIRSGTRSNGSTSPSRPPGRRHRALAAEARPRSAPRGPARVRAGRPASTSDGSIAVTSGSLRTPFPSTRQTGRGHR